MLNTSEYRALMRVMQTFGFQQYKRILNKFYKNCDGRIIAQIVNEPDQQYDLDTCIDVELYSDQIIFKYNKYAALESGALTNIHCSTSCKFSVSEFIQAYSKIIEEIFNSTSYEFMYPTNYEFEYENRTPMVIVMKDLK